MTSLTVSASAPARLPRDELLRGSASLQHTAARLQDAQRSAHAAECAGADILAALAAQRAQLVRTQNTVAEAHAEVQQSSTILNRMGRWYNRALGL